MRASIFWIFGGVILAATACGGGQHRAANGSGFQCHERAASYLAVKHISGDEIGVAIDCQDAGPRLKRWRQDKSGHRDEDTHPISPADFDHIWNQISGTGWENLKDCGNGSLEKRDPVYTFDVKDDQNKATFSCQTREVPYPYFDITNALDFAAHQGRKQLGDDEPPEAKALDHKDKQR